MSNLSGSPVAARNKPSPNPASTTRRKILMKNLFLNLIHCAAALSLHFISGSNI